MRPGPACCFLLAIALSRAAEPTPVNPRFTGTPLLRVWRSEDYGASLLNTRVLAAPSGLIYVANNDGLLEFDGEKWRLIPLPREGAARALAIDARERIWVFGHDDVARLEPDAHGELHAVSALESLPSEARATGTVNRAAVTPDGVYARGQRFLMLFKPDGTVQTWPGANPNGLIWTLDGALYAELETLTRVSPGGLTVVPLGNDAAEADAQSGLRVFAARKLADGSGRALLLTMRGPATWGGPGKPIEKISAEAAALFSNDQASAGAFLADGRLALGTERSGLYIFETDGRLSQHLTREHGLPGNRVNDLAVDEQGGLWLAMQEGLARLDLESPLALHGQSQGLSGSARRFAVWHDQLYFSTSEGVARRDPFSGRFSNVAGFQVGANRPLAVGERLVASTRGLREILADDRSRSWTSELIGPIATLARSPGWICAGSSAGLSLLRATDTGWETAGRLSTIERGIDELLDAGDGWLWFVTRNGEVGRVDFRNGPRLDAPVEMFTPALGIPEAARNDHVQLQPIGRELIVFCTEWMRRYDTEGDRFVPETRPVLAGLALLGARPVGRSGLNSAWLRPAHRPAWLLHIEPGNDGAWQQTGLSIAPLRGLVFDSLFEEETTHTLWLAGQGALASVDLAWHPTHPAAPLRVSLRRIETEAGELLRAGNPLPDPIALSAKQDALRVTYAAQTYRGDYRGRDHTSYRSRLEGLDSDWTPWSTDTRRDFTNLPYRNFRFRVQARTPDGREGESPVFAFTVLPPWWFSGWAWAGYGAAGIVAVAGYIRLRTRALRRRAEQLEAIVAARTEDLRRSNVELARLNRLELDEKVAARLAEEKARLELLRYQLNPHFLLNAFTTLRGLVFSAPESAGEMVAKLAEFCRHALTRTDENGGTVADEAGLIETYLATEKSRWRDELACSVETDPAVASVRLPPFLLQPLVENAVKYGGRTTAGRLEVRVRIAGDGRGGLRIEITNTGEWVGEDSPHRRGSTGLGLDNLRQRLRRYYPEAHSFDVQSADGWVHVLLHLHQPARDPFATHPAH